MNIYRATENVNIEALLGYKDKNGKHYFLDDYEEKGAVKK